MHVPGFPVGTRNASLSLFTNFICFHSLSFCPDDGQAVRVLTMDRQCEFMALICDREYSSMSI